MLIKYLKLILINNKIKKNKVMNIKIKAIINLNLSIN